MSSQRIKISDVTTGVVTWEGTTEEIRANKKISKDLVRMVEQTAADRMRRIRGQWKAEKA